MPHDLRSHDSPPLTPGVLLRGYRAGIFPMAETRDADEVFWLDPDPRGILPLNGFHISRSLARFLKKDPYTVTLNRDFEGVVLGCADRRDTWINDQILAAYTALHHAGHAHALEVWDGDRLAGGVYGVAIGGAFFGESMFSRRENASKVALAYLVTHLRNCGFYLFDTQFVTDHLRSLGAVEISREAYHDRLRAAVAVSASVHHRPLPDRGLQICT